ncbi:MAG TPA: D-aminoacylase [Bacteroidota bacterium]
MNEMTTVLSSPFNDIRGILLVCSFSGLLLTGCQRPTECDLVIRNASIYDGRGGEPYNGDIAVTGDSISAIGSLKNFKGRQEVDAHGLVAAPGFINMLSQASVSLIEDGRSESDLRQGVTLEVMGEGTSMGPLNNAMKKEMVDEQSDVKFDVKWTTLGEYLDYLVSRGISTNVASFVGATTVRVHELGNTDRAPTAKELERMRALVRQAMEEGAMGVGSALIYVPAFYAKTDELVELSKIAAAYDGMYISHVRSEGNQLLQAVDELITIARRAGIRAEIYHLKAAGKQNWYKLDGVIGKIDSARAAGLAVTANMYNYTAAETGLDAAMPPWVQVGGLTEWQKRLKDYGIRLQVKKEMTTPSDQWENLYLDAGSADNVLLVGFRNPKLKPLTGKSLADVAAMRGKSSEETAMDLVIEDNSRVSTVYFLMSEDNVRKQIALPWVSFGSDEESLAPEGNFLKYNPHPRAYGNVARLLGKYVREEKVISLQEAIRKLASLPAENLRIQRRGKLLPGYYADIVLFDPATIQDHATYDKPAQFATGVEDVFVNGIQVIRNGEHTGAKPGRFVHGPGWKGRP